MRVHVHPRVDPDLDRVVTQGEAKPTLDDLDHGGYGSRVVGEFLALVEGEQDDA